MRRFTATTLSLFIFSAFAAGLNQNIPVQSYEQVGSPTPKAKKIEKTVEPEKQKAQADSKKHPEAKPVEPSSVNYTAVRTLQAEVAQINQNSLKYQQKMDEKILLISNRINMLEGASSRLQKALILLSGELQVLQKKPSGSDGVHALLQNQQPVQEREHWMEYWAGYLGVWGVILLMLVALGILAFLARFVWGRKKPVVKADENIDTEDEYDYMGSEEGTLAKLNLAHAYIKMKDFDSAKSVLDEVIKNGNEHQQQEARELKKKCQ